MRDEHPRLAQNARTRCYPVYPPCTGLNHPKVSPYNRISSQNEDKDGDSDNAISELPPALQDVSPDRRRSSSDTSRSAYSLTRRISSKGSCHQQGSSSGQEIRLHCWLPCLLDREPSQVEGTLVKTSSCFAGVQGKGPALFFLLKHECGYCMCRWTGREECRPACASAWLGIVGRKRGKTPLCSLCMHTEWEHPKLLSTCNCFSAL